MDYEFLKKLLNTVSVSGNEDANQENALEYGRAFADRQMTDPVGNAISVVNPDAKCKVLLVGHMDEIGFRVTHINDAGMLRVQKAGGVRASLYVGAPMQIIHEIYDGDKITRTKVEGVGVITSDMLKNKELSDSDLVIDIGASSKEEAEAVVSIGDCVCADTTVHELLGNNFSSRALDDKTGAFVILEAAKRAKEKKASCGIYAQTAVGEETTGRGAYFAGEDIRPSCALVVDVTWASDCPGTDPGETGFVKLGGGPVLCISGTTNKKLNRLMEQIAGEKGIPLQYETAGARTGTDGDTIIKTGAGVPIVLVSIPLRYMHSSVEVGNKDDLENCIELISEFLVRIEENFDYCSLHV